MSSLQSDTAPIATPDTIDPLVSASSDMPIDTQMEIQKDAPIDTDTVPAVKKPSKKNKKAAEAEPDTLPPAPTGDIPSWLK